VPWSREKANKWYDEQPWLIGCNFLPATAVNDVEMWRGETFDPATIDRELGLAASIGFNTIRVFLNFVVWQGDPAGLKKRIDQFLSIAARHGISVMLVLFDDCNFADRVARDEPQPDPVPGVTNSQWVSSPPLALVKDRAAWPKLENYIKDIVGTFGQDSRVIVWDLYNEAANSNMCEKSAPLVEAAFRWAREARPIQPLTVCAWIDYENPISQLFMELSDVVSFHTYLTIDKVREQIALCRKHGRPLICTEWLTRPYNSIEEMLPLLHQERIGSYHWGLVTGRTQTCYTWQSKPGDPEPELWQHDLFRADGTPFRAEEIALFKSLADKAAGSSRH
jgi:hypothetical protein